MQVINILKAHLVLMFCNIGTVIVEYCMVTVELIIKSVCFQIIPDNYVVTDHGACVRTCSGNTYEVDEGGIRKCAKCDGLCPKGSGLSYHCATSLTYLHNKVGTSWNKNTGNGLPCRDLDEKMDTALTSGH